MGIKPLKQRHRLATADSHGISELCDAEPIVKAL